MHAFLQKIVTWAALLACAVSANQADAQWFSGWAIPVEYGYPAVGCPCDPCAPAPAAAVPQSADTRFIHGRGLIGMNVFGPNQELLGTIDDFVIDKQGESPVVFLAIAPRDPGLAGQYVIVPFNALTHRFDPQQGINWFTLNMSSDNLSRSPRLAFGQWYTAIDPQLFVSARQFYRPVERTAARPLSGGGQEERPLLRPQEQRPGEAMPPVPQQRPSEAMPPVPQQQRPGDAAPPEKTRESAPPENSQPGEATRLEKSREATPPEKSPESRH